MSPQERLFDSPPTRGASRADGPSTSRDAARSMSGQVLRDQQYLVLSAFLPQPTANAYEVWVRLNRRTGSAPKENVISKRLSELAEAGMVKLTRYKRTGSSSREQQVYEATDRGLEYLRMRVAI